MQVPAKDRAQFAQFLQSLGYPWVEETNNPAYQLFLTKVFSFFDRYRLSIKR